MRRLSTGAFAAAVIAIAIGASVGGASADTSLPVSRRVLVVSLPGITWEDLRDADLPNLDRLVSESAIANLSPRVRTPRTHPGDGYATVGAGTEALAPDGAAGVALEPGESYENGTAHAAFRRRGGRAGDHAVEHLRMATIDDLNADGPFDGHPGLLGDTLARAGVGRGVVADADETLHPTDDADYHREAALAMIDSSGTVECGAVGESLLRRDASAPFGLRLDDEATVRAFDRCWQGRSTVLVEASDIRRAAAYRNRVTAAERERMVAEALGRTDALLGRLMRFVERDDAVVLVSPSAPTSGPARLTVFGVRARGLEPGLLESDSTRQPGYVTIVDVAPTIGELAGAPLDEEEIEGRAVSRASSGGTAASRVDRLVDADADARFRGRMLSPIAITFVVLVIVLAVVFTACALFWRVPRWPFEFASLVILSALPLTYLAALLPFGTWGAAAYCVFVFGGAAVVAAGLTLTRPWDAPVAAVCCWSLAVTGVSVVALHSRLHLSTVFGDSPIIAGRFSGVNNVTFAQLMVASIVLAVLAVHRWPGRPGRTVMVTLFLAVIVLDGAPMFGADVGGVLGGVTALLVTAGLLWGVRLRARHVIVAGAITALVIGAFALVDLAASSSRQSHLGRLFERVGAEGSSGLTTVVSRKWTAALRSTTDSVWRWVPVPILGLAGLLALRQPDMVRRFDRRLPELRSGLIGMGVAAVLGFALNDSGVAVPGMMFTMLTPLVVLMAVRADVTTDPDDELDGVGEMISAGVG